MPVQVIINGVSPEDALGQMAAFLGLKRMDTPPEANAITGTGGTAGNGAAIEMTGAGTVGEAAANKPATTRKGRPPKQKEEPAQEAETQVNNEDFQLGDEEQQPAAATPDDVRKALNDVYLKRYGMEATQKDILKLYGLLFKDGSVSKVSDIPEGMHQAVIDGINEMAEKNPFKRERVDARK